MKSRPSASDNAYSGFVDRLRICIEIAGSVTALARQAGLSQPGLRRYLFGGDPSRRALTAIASGAGVSEDWLFSGKSPICAQGSELAIRAEHTARDLAAREQPLPRWVTVVLRAIEISTRDSDVAQPDPALFGELVVQLGLAAGEYANHREGISARILEVAVGTTFEEIRADLIRRPRLPPQSVLSAILQAHLYRLGVDFEQVSSVSHAPATALTNAMSSADVHGSA